MRSAPLPFPELPDKITEEMARLIRAGREDSPLTARMLFDTLRSDPAFNDLLSVEDVLQSLTRLREAGLVSDRPVGVARTISFHLTTRGKLNQGLS